LFELKIAEDGRIVVFIEDKLEILVVDDLLDLVDVAFEVYAVELEAQLEILIVEDSDAGLWIISEHFYYSRWVQ
jgi:hypothetical protein